MVAITVIQILQFRDRLFIPSDALDGAHELTRVKFSAADIDDGCVRYRSVVDRAREPLFDPAVAAVAYYQDELARLNPAGLDLRYGQRFGHATRCPSRQTLRTTGMSRAICTRIRSARFPTAISPRSARPTASAGVLVTVRTAEARSIAGTSRGNCSAAIRRLDGI